jgi:uncharacterized DUF497 family protein
MGRSEEPQQQDEHGLYFADAPLVLSGRCVTFIDDRVQYGETRLVSFGTLAGSWWWLSTLRADRT